jgi:AcrR family transcriptional regulator
MTERTITTRSTILDTALELFRTNGFESTPMDSIATAAEVAKGTLYYHFDSKEGIIDAIVDREAAAVREQLIRVELDSDLGFEDRYRSAVAIMTNLIGAIYAKLQKIKYIDIRDKTMQAMVEFCAPPFARILELGNAAGRCRVEHALEFAELTLAFAQFLGSPGAGEPSIPRRIKALTRFTAVLLGMDSETVERIYAPLGKQFDVVPALAGKAGSIVAERPGRGRKPRR